LTQLLMNSYEMVTGRITMKVEAEDVFVLIDTAIPCGLILNELVTNALKHAFPDNRKGTIFVRIHRTHGQNTILHVSDDGIGLPEGFDFRKKNTMGMLTIHALVKQLQGTVAFSGQNRAVCQVTFRDNLYQPRV
jgi:two-component sensor histidine kinase